VRLVKYLAHSGVASRRTAEELIAAGRVRVSGEVVTDPARDVGEGSGVEVHGRPVAPEPREVWAVNKPAGVVSTAREPGRRPAVTELVDSERRLYPVGRLDADSTGLILLTNDGELANRLTHPRYGVPKTYRVRLARQPSDGDLDRLRGGVRLEDGMTAPADVVRKGEREIEIAVREGRKRQLKRMAAAVGNEVEALTRVRFGSLELGELRRGEARRLDEREVDSLWKDPAR
jgi:23S rRNA pseudouridine2605 synthase